MKCFNHHDRDAFGICTSCGKGLCLECMDATGENVVCKNSNCKNKIKRYKTWHFILAAVVILAILLMLFD